MNACANRNLLCTALGLALAALTPLAPANLLVDPGFEVNPLQSYVNVLNDFPTYQGLWGVEAASISGVDGTIVPFQGVQMLRMVDDGLVTTQAFQVTDVTSYAALIDSGAANVYLSAMLNVDSHVPAALASVSVQFFSAANYGSQIGSAVTGGITLDNVDGTWEMASVAAAVPVGTRWLVSQVAYNNASLLGVDGVVYPGYVDAADLRIPEPASLALLALTAAFVHGRRRVG